MAEGDVTELVLADAEERMQKALNRTRSEFASVRTGRATPSLFEKLNVDYYGSMVPMQQLAGFSVSDSRTLLVTPFDRSSIGAIERAIQEANLGLNPSNDGNSIRLMFPPLTEERRRDLVKMVRSKAEEGRTGVRAARRDARKDLEAFQKDGELSEDELHRESEAIDKMAKKFEAEIDAALDHKTAELMEV